MSSKKLIAAAMAAIMTVGTVSAVTASATQGVDEWTIDGAGAGTKQVDSAEINPYFAIALKDLAPNVTPNFTTIQDKTKDEGNDYHKELGLALWEDNDTFKFTDFKGGTATLNMIGTAVEYVELRVEQRVGPTANTTANTVEYQLTPISSTGEKKTLLVPKLQDGYMFAVTPADAAAITNWDDYTKNTTVDMYIVKTSAYNKGNAAGSEPDAPIADATADCLDSGKMNTFVVNEATGGDNKGKWMADTAANANSSAAYRTVFTKTVTQKETQNIGSGLRNSTFISGTNAAGTTKAGMQTSTVQFTPSFGTQISKTSQLVKIDINKSSVTIDVSGTINGTSWNNFYKDGWALNGSTDWTWSWIVADNKGEFGNQTNPINPFAVLVGQENVPGAYANAPKLLKSDPKLTESKPDMVLPRTLNWTPVNNITGGTTGTTLSFGNLVPPAVLKALNEGGTITFEFTRELKGNEYFFGTVMFGYNNGTYANSINVSPTYGNGKTATVEIPAGLTYYKDEKNPWQSVGLGWSFDFQKLGGGLLVNNGATTPTATDNKTDTTIPTYDPAKASSTVDIVKMTFTAKGAKVDNTSGSTTSNGGNTSGSGSSGNKTDNPGTGVALAIAPAVLAAGAFVVVASKKRK